MIRGRWMLRAWVVAAGLGCAAFGAARAQDSVVVIDPNAPPDSLSRPGLPSEVLSQLISAYNDSSTLKFSGNVTVPPGSRLVGLVAIYHGAVIVAGEVDGGLIVINGDLRIRAGGRVTGDILVAGGRFTQEPGATRDGGVRAFWNAAPVVRLTDGTLALRERRRPLSELASARKSFQTGRVRTTLLLATNETYNRIEGLPVIFGPAFDWAATERIQGRLELRGILRTAGDDSPFRRDLGYSVRTDWSFGRARRFGLGARAYSQVTGIEDQNVGRDEIGWSAFLLQRDNRDYFNAEGVGGSAYLYADPRLRLDLSLRRERQSSLGANDPWSLLRNDERWRPNPLIDDGHYAILGLGLDWDSRNHRDYPTSGWLARVNYEYASSDDVAPVTLPTLIRDPVPTDRYGFSRLVLEARRYNRLTPNAQVNFRLWAGGWLAGDPLPVQRRLSLGGVGALPGYPFRSFTCTTTGFPDPSNAAWCDRAITLQTEFRSRFRLGLGYEYRDPERREFTRFIGIEEADLVIFADGGKAWLAGDGPGRVPSDRIPTLREWKGDVGAGIDAGGIGVYLAKALTDGQPVRFFVRLRRRF